MKIGFFDSGLGGLTVLKEIINTGKLNEDIFYLGDTKNTPYGIKDENFVRNIIDENIDYLVNIGCNPIVIACNTATSLSIKNLREKYPNIVFIGTEPAVKVAADAHMNKKIIVFATSITVRQEKLLNLIESLNIKENVELVPADKLVQFAEDVDCVNKTDEINEYIENLLKKYNLEEYSHIVLGCTHFPLFYNNFASVISKLSPDNNIMVIDGAKGIAKNLFKNISEMKEKTDNSNSQNIVHIITTSHSISFEKRASQILSNKKIEFEYKLH